MVIDFKTTGRLAHVADEFTPDNIERLMSMDGQCSRSIFINRFVASDAHNVGAESLVGVHPKSNL